VRVHAAARQPPPAPWPHASCHAALAGGRFADENFRLRHTGPGVLSMANSGPGSNKSQFFLCTAAAPHLDGKHVVFGQVEQGLEVVKAIELCGTPSGQPIHKVAIVDCGQLS
jgi:cyclophilin family peptidyl-prolyl cis-trans isomerase